MEGLTRRQKDVFDYLKKYINDNGYAPCVRDICDALDLKSTSTAHAHLTKLGEQGLHFTRSGQAAHHHDTGRQHGQRAHGTCSPWWAG